MRVLTHTKLMVQSGMARMRRALLGPHARAVLCDSPVNGRLLVPLEDMVVGRRLAFDGAWDAERVEALLDFLRANAPGGRVLVVGAHVGALAVPLARGGFPVTAFEANPEVCELLRMNVALNGPAEVEVHNLAAVDRPGSERFLLSRVNTGGSKVTPREDRFIYRYDRPREVTVEGVALDDLLDGDPFDLVVMDVEGSEHRAALGMRRVLGEARLLLVEFLPHHVRDVAGVSLETWLEPFLEAFEHAAIAGRPDGAQGQDGRWLGPEELRRELERLYDADVGADLYFAAEPFDGLV